MLQNIKVSQILRGNLPRQNPEDNESLVISINNTGLIEPLLVNQGEDGTYFTIDGARRLEAVKKLKWNEVPCRVVKLSLQEAAVRAYVVNTEREDFTPIEKALYIKFLQEEHGFTLKELEMMGCGTPAALSYLLNLLNLPESVQERINKGELTAAHGKQLLRLSSPGEQERTAKQVCDSELSANRTKIKVSKYLQKCRMKNKVKADTPVPDGDIPGVYFKDSRDMSENGKGTVALIVASPPYSYGMEFEKDVPFEVHLDETKDVLKEAARVVMPSGIIALNVADIHRFKNAKNPDAPTSIKLMGHWYQSQLRKYGFDLVDIIIWEKNQFWAKRPHTALTEKTIHTRYQTLNNCEPVYIFRKRGERDVPPEEEVIQRSMLTKNEWGPWASSVWKIDAVQNQKDHPSQYPEELCHRLIKMYSFQGDTVLDPWLGSGTTVKVARDLNRVGIGYERDLRYKSLIMKKLGVVPPAEGKAAGPLTEFANKALSEDIVLTETDGDISQGPPLAKPAEIIEVSVAADEPNAAEHKNAA